MLKPPALADDLLLACLRDAYGVRAGRLEFLPLGADPDTTVYRLTAADGAVFFVKLRSGAFDEVTVAVPHLLHRQGSEHVIAPILAKDGRLYTRSGAYAVVVYPFVAGRDGSQTALSASQWTALGRALHSLHATEVPADLARRIPRETFAAAWREQVRAVLCECDTAVGAWMWPAADDAAQAAAGLLQSERAKVLALVDHAERLAAVLAAKQLPYVLCHADIHVWNLLITAEGALHIVDWDTVLFAPKERDLMFFGSGLGGRQQPEQAAAFYAGYGECAVDADALAYYRCERVVEDIAVYCRELLRSTAGGADRQEQLRQLASQFEGGGVVDIALMTT